MHEGIGFRSQHLNPYRAVDWRAARVDAILAEGPHRQPSRYDDDSLIWEYFRLRQRAQGASAGRLRELFCGSPAVFVTELIRRDRETLLPFVIEARILAGQTDREIAAAVSTYPDIISKYADLCFHVRDRLTQRDWIVTQVLPPAPPGRGEPSRRDALGWLLRTAAFAGGTDALHEVLEIIPPVETTARQRGETWSEGLLASVVRREGLLAAMTDVSSTGSSAACALALRVVEQARREKWARHQAGQSPENDFYRTITGIMEQVQLTVGGTPDYGLPAGVAKRVRDSPFELRPAQRMQLKKHPEAPLLDELEAAAASLRGGEPPSESGAASGA